MNHPDDYIEVETSFLGDATGEVFAVKEASTLSRQPIERSFETQSGFLVLVKPVGNRYSLSFKRQIGTPPTSSIFLTPDEARRLSNLLGPDFESDTADPYAGNISEFEFASLSPKYGKSSANNHLVAIVGTLTLIVVIAVVAYQLKFHTGQ